MISLLYFAKCQSYVFQGLHAVCVRKPFGVCRSYGEHSGPVSQRWYRIIVAHVSCELLLASADYFTLDWYRLTRAPRGQYYSYRYGSVQNQYCWCCAPTRKQSVVLPIAFTIMEALNDINLISLNTFDEKSFQPRCIDAHQYTVELFGYWRMASALFGAFIVSVVEIWVIYLSWNFVTQKITL